MLCHCKEFCFTYETIKKINDKKSGVYRINKCGTILADSKKKKKCNFFQEMFIREFFIEDIKPHKDLTITSTKKKPDYLSQLHWNIHLYEMINETNNKTGTFDNSITNYLTNINYFLNILKYKLFFEEHEGIEGLKLRLKGPPDNIKVREKNIYPIILIDMPEYLKPNYKCKSKKRKMYKQPTKSSNMEDIFKKLDQMGKESDLLNKNKNPDEEREDEDEDEDEEEYEEEDGGFDIDDYVSDNEDPYKDEGEFSD